MDDRHQFAILLLASRLGLLSKAQVKASADQQILNSNKPDYWLLELSMEGNSEELRHLLESGDDTVYKGVLRMALQQWIDGSISDQVFGTCCDTLWKYARYAYSGWYSDLVWIVDEFDLVAQGVIRREDAVRKVKEVIEKYLET